MDDKYRITRPGYLPVGYEVKHPKLPVDEYVPPQPKKEPFIPGGYQNGKVKLSNRVKEKPKHHQHSRVSSEKKASKWPPGRVILWLSMALMAAPFVLWWAIVKIAKPDDR